MTRILIASSSPQVRDQVQATCAEMESVFVAASVATVDQLWSALEADQTVEVVLLDESLGDDAGYEVARELGIKRPLLATVIVVGRTTPQTLGAAMDAGARSVVALPPSLEEFRSRIESAGEWSRSARRQLSAEARDGDHAGKVIAVVGAKGGVGTTLLTLLLGRSSAATGGTTCIVDLDVRKGDLAAYAGVAARRSIVDLVDIADELTGRALGEATCSLSHGIQLIPAPTDGENGELLTGSATRQIISALRYQYEHVVIDCGSRLDDVTAMALEVCDAIVVVVTPDVPALRSARRLVESLERLEITSREKAQVFVNSLAKSSDVQPSLVPRVTGLPVVATAPRLGATLEGAMNTATVLEQRLPELERPLLAVRALTHPAQATPIGTPSRRRGARRKGGPVSADREAGQMAVEMPVVMTVAVFLVLVCVQMVLWGVSHVVASNAAQEAARSYAVGSSATQVHAEVQDRIPGGWQRGWQMSAPTSDVVTVSVRTPSIVPSLIPAVSSEATIVWER